MSEPSIEGVRARVTPIEHAIAVWAAIGIATLFHVCAIVRASFGIFPGSPIGLVSNVAAQLLPHAMALAVLAERASGRRAPRRLVEALVAAIGALVLGQVLNIATGAGEGATSLLEKGASGAIESAREQLRNYFTTIFWIGLPTSTLGLFLAATRRAKRTEGVAFGAPWAVVNTVQWTHGAATFSPTPGLEHFPISTLLVPLAAFAIQSALFPLFTFAVPRLTVRLGLREP